MRFPEFEVEWERKKLGDVAEKISAKNKDNKISLVFSNSATQGIICQNEYFDKSIANKNNLAGYYIVESLNFVYNPRISVYAEVGAMSLNKTGKKGIVSPLYTVFKITDTSVDVFFAETLFKSKIWHNYMRSIANYGARDDRMSIKDEDFFHLPLKTPSLKEQTKIASFLSLIDERIQTQMKIIEELEKLIKGLYFVVFTAKNELYPMEKLGKVCNIKKGQQINNSELLETGKYYVMNGGITPSGYHSEYNTENNTISISEGGNSCGYVQYNTEKFWSGGHCYTLNIITEKVTTKYLYHYLKSCESYSTPI